MLVGSEVRRAGLRFSPPASLVLASLTWLMNNLSACGVSSREGLPLPFVSAMNALASCKSSFVIKITASAISIGERVRASANFPFACE